MRGLRDSFYRRILLRNARLIGGATANAGDFVRLADHHCCLVATYGKNGEAVPSTLRFAIDDAKLYFRLAPNALELERIHGNPSVRIAACNARGRPKMPVELLAGIARILQGDESCAAEALLQVKYGLQRSTLSREFGGRWEYVLVSPVAPLPASIVGEGHQMAVRIGRAAVELEEVLERIKAAYPSSRHLAAAVEEGLAELRVYSQATHLFAPTQKRAAERTKLIEQLDRSAVLVQEIRHCEEWYGAGLMQSDDGQRALELSGIVHSNSLELPLCMRLLEAQFPESCPTGSHLVACGGRLCIG